MNATTKKETLMPSKRFRLPHRRNGISATLGNGQGSLHIHTGEYEDGRLGEVFLDHQREGTFGQAMMHAFAMCLSIGLQHGVPLETFTRTFRDFRMEPDLIRDIFVLLEQEYGGCDCTVARPVVNSDERRESDESMPTRS